MRRVISSMAGGRGRGRERGSGSGASNSSSSSGGSPSSSPSSSSEQVVAIVDVAGASNADEWNDDMLRGGDVVHEISVGSLSLCSPFDGGSDGLQKQLHRLYRGNDSLVRVRVHRGRDRDQVAELQACLIPDRATGKAPYTLRSLRDPNYIVGFRNSTLHRCLALQNDRDARVEAALARAQLRDGFVAYPWDANIARYGNSMPAVGGVGGLYSLLVVPWCPHGSTHDFSDVDDTVLRAHTWLLSSQDSGVPINCVSIQTEPLLTKISGEKASRTVNTGSMTELWPIANAGLYGFEDYHGVDIGVVRAIRIWYAAAAGELCLRLNIEETDGRLGFAITRTDEGFFVVSSVDDDDDDNAAAAATDSASAGSPASRSGLSRLFREARRAGKQLVITRVGDDKIVPWMVSSTGGIRCFDSVSVSQKLSLHRHARRPVVLRLMLWETSTNTNINTVQQQQQQRLQFPVREEPARARAPVDDYDGDRGEDGRALRSRDTAGEFSFRNLPSAPAADNWV